MTIAASLDATKTWVKSTLLVSEISQCPTNPNLPAYYHFVLDPDFSVPSGA